MEVLEVECMKQKRERGDGKSCVLSHSALPPAVAVTSVVEADGAGVRFGGGGRTRFHLLIMLPNNPWQVPEVAYQPSTTPSSRSSRSVDGIT